MDGRIVDTNCSVDKWETCLVHEFCPTDGCKGEKLMALAEFLYCFEGENHANVSFKSHCARVAGIDLGVNSKIARKCRNDRLQEKLWERQLNSPERAKLQHFPTVLLDGVEFDTDGNQTLAESICAKLSGPKPEGCAGTPSPSPPPSPANPCLGHRCDTGACPCGCECGNDEDPGLCYVPQSGP